MSDISLTAGIRSNLLSLQKTSSLLARTQERLGTGKKVNSPIDNPTNFFTAESLNNRASDLTARLDGITKGINTVKAADAGIKSIKGLISQAKGIANDARALSTDTADTQAVADRSALAVRFNTIRTQIDELSADSGYDGVNLLANDDLTVEFGEKIGSSTLDLNGFTATATGLGVAAAANDFASNTDVDAAIADLQDAEATLRKESKTLSANLGVLTSRQDFTKSLASVLTSGASDLVNADLNEESANLLALNTQQSLGVNSLSLASQASQSVLRLLQ
ncbi:MAG TPA: flagellin [Opitutaceae bacterium]|nr:flagellin [Opitutaceae bacterium]